MQLAICSGLALMRWEGVGFLNDFSSRDFTWLAIGALLGIVVFWGVSQRRRRWFKRV
jgi:hypothetical protein